MNPYFEAAQGMRQDNCQIVFSCGTRELEEAEKSFFCRRRPARGTGSSFLTFTNRFASLRRLLAYPNAVESWPNRPIPTPACRLQPTNGAASSIRKLCCLPTFPKL